MEWFQIGSGYYGVAPQDVGAAEPTSQVIDAAVASAFGLSSDEARVLFAADSPSGRTAAQPERDIHTS